MAKTQGKGGKSTKKKGEGRRRARRRVETFSSYIYKVLKQGALIACEPWLPPPRARARRPLPCFPALLGSLSRPRDPHHALHA